MEATGWLNYGWSLTLQPSRPLWMVDAPTIVLPLWWLGRRWREQRRPRRGLCPACGYDLRATPERCPECGTEAKPQPAQGGAMAAVSKERAAVHRVRRADLV